MTAFIVDQPCPIKVPEGFQLVWNDILMLFIALPDVTAREADAVRKGRIVHRFGVNDHTAWMTLHFSDGFGSPLSGEIFFSAGAQPDAFTDEKLAELRTALSPEIGLTCQLILVDQKDQRIVAMRVYAWSNELSLAFLDACERTRTVSRDDLIHAQDALLRQSNAQLAQRATLTFEVFMK